MAEEEVPFVLVLFDEVVELPLVEVVVVEFEAELVALAEAEAETEVMMVVTKGTLTVVSTRLPSEVTMPMDWENEVERMVDCSWPKMITRE